METSDTRDWLLLLFELPASQSNLRVKVWRRLQKMGALNLKAGVYVLPKNPDTEEDFGWLRQTMADAGTQVQMLTAQAATDSEHESILRQFQDLRALEYRDLINRAETLSKRAKRAKHPPSRNKHEEWLRDVRDGLEKLDEISKVDFFPSRISEEAKRKMAALKLQAQFKSPDSKKIAVKKIANKFAKTYLGKTWVTRSGMHVDRLASAWLIRRFIDPKAKFAFVDARASKKIPATRIPFDMAGAEFGHHGEDCTFETLLKRFALTGDRALMALGEIVHDVDIKDEKFRREEAPGLDWTIRSLRQSLKGDKELLKEGERLFSSLYMGLR